MGISGARDSQDRHRAGARVLSLFANPLNTRILRAHSGSSRRLTELRRELGWAPEATVRAAVNGLLEGGALVKRAEEGGRRVGSTSLTAAGEEMLAVADDLEAWLAACPQGTIAIDDDAAKVAVRALADGWSSAVMRELAAAPLALTELSARIPDLSYPALERRLNWMRQTGQLAPVERQGRGVPLAPTDWLRRALAPLCRAGRCEIRHLPDSPPVTAVEVEAAFLLTLPLVRLGAEVSGRCLLAVLVDGEGDGKRPLVGVEVEVEGGEISAGPAERPSEPENWALGSTEPWLDAVLDGGTDGLRIGGADPDLAAALVRGLHEFVFVDRRPRRTTSA